MLMVHNPCFSLTILEITIKKQFKIISKKCKNIIKGSDLRKSNNNNFPQLLKKYFIN